MPCYLVTLDTDKKDSALSAILDLGAKELEFFHDGLLTLSSDAPINLSAVDGVTASQEVLVAQEHCYIVFLDDDACEHELEETLRVKGARIIKYHENTHAIQIDSGKPLDLDGVPGISYVEREVEVEDE